MPHFQQKEKEVKENSVFFFFPWRNSGGGCGKPFVQVKQCVTYCGFKINQKKKPDQAWLSCSGLWPRNTPRWGRCTPPAGWGWAPTAAGSTWGWGPAAGRALAASRSGSSGSHLPSSQCCPVWGRRMGRRWSGKTGGTERRMRRKGYKQMARRYASGEMAN